MNADQAISELLAKYNWSRETLEVWIKADFCCEYCGVDLLRSVDDYYYNAQLDHLLPQSKQGTDDSSNLVLSCKTCNTLKRNYVFHENKGSDSRQDVMRRVRAFLLQRRTAKLLELAQTRGLCDLLRTDASRA